MEGNRRDRARSPTFRRKSAFHIAACWSKIGAKSEKCSTFNEWRNKNKNLLTTIRVGIRRCTYDCVREKHSAMKNCSIRRWLSFSLTLLQQGGLFIEKTTGKIALHSRSQQIFTHEILCHGHRVHSNLWLARERAALKDGNLGIAASEHEKVSRNYGSQRRVLGVTSVIFMIYPAPIALEGIQLAISPLVKTASKMDEANTEQIDKQIPNVRRLLFGEEHSIPLRASLKK